MKKFRFLLFLLLIFGLLGASFILTKERVQTPFSHSFAPLFQELGKPIKSVDRIVSRMLPIDTFDEKMLGDEIKQRFAANSSLNSEEDLATVKYLNALIKSLSEVTKKQIEYRVFLVEGPPNAFAMPGGALCITTGLMEILTNESELVAVLGHEIGHVERGHLFDAVRGELLRRKVTELSLSSYALDAIQTVMKSNFSKTLEDEADEYAFRMLIKKGYDPFAMSTAFEKFLQFSAPAPRISVNPFEDFFATHPYIELRIEKFRSKAKLYMKKKPKYKRYLGKRNFNERNPASTAEYPDEWSYFNSNPVNYGQYE